MYKPKNWDALSPVEQEAWRVKDRESCRKYYEANREKKLKKRRKYREANREKLRERWHKHYAANPEKQRESARKAAKKAKQQAAADQFFIMAGAAEQLTKLKPKQ